MQFRSLRSILPIVLAVLAFTAVSSYAAESGEPAVVHFQNRNIATLRATLGPLTPQERADGAERRLSQSAGDYRRPVMVVPYGDARSIVLGDRMIFGIVPEDVDASAGETVDDAATAAAENLREALVSWGEQRRPDVVVRGVTRLLIASALALVLFFVLRLVRSRIMRLLPSRAERALQKRHVTIFGQDLGGVAVKALRLLVDSAFVVAALMLLYTWLTFSLRQFPLTEPWGDGLAGFLVGTLGMIGLGILHAIPDMIVVVLVLLLARFAVRLVASLFDAVERGQIKMRGIHPDTADATRRIVTALVWVFGIAIAYPFIPGSNSDAFKGISVLVGLMISLGSSGVINQAMSGMVVVFSRALKAGEYVDVAGYEGTVTEVGALSTKLRTKRNEEINIPNALLVSSTAKNYSRLAGETGAMVYSTAGIGYDAPWRVVHKILIDAALRTPGLKRDPPPYVRQSALESFCVNYVILAYLERPEDRLQALSDLHANIQDGFNEAGIQIMTPAFESQPAEPIVVPKSKWGDGQAAVDRRTP
jgi:small-conductance mechanosensitive channel